ncbi:uncharacterized protein BJ171DRAFT_239281 [Polychytrium aggregatum]|uniref:uncharacterized protein n=1 Tax=Polychytrium aggregatum TaxID=110093 RepID=UPI0022FDCD4D|nr:uncharacterized protein BJ171DRAFT_239281 [Polychytrium aggregatum]KAI9208398.1 hypothetical protein BJ171DRAFT_239281 [Polychytrium aggregatum]
MYPRFGPEEFGLGNDDLARICNFDNREAASQIELLNEEYGGVEGIAYLLKSNVETGLPIKSSHETRLRMGHEDTKPGHYAKITPDDEARAGKVDLTPVDDEARKILYGKNISPPPASASILEIVWETVKEDPILKILLVGAVVVLSLGTSMCPSTGWGEGLAILIAVVIVLSVTAGNDYSKDRKFKKLLLIQSDKKVKVIRGGVKDQISSWDIVVGDLVEIQTGDEIPADGFFVSGNRLVVDESPLTGESAPVKKGPLAPFLFSGCQVSEGSGLMLVALVGPRSSGGQIQELLSEAQNQETVLQEKLKVVAILIGKIGVAAGILTFLGLTTRWAINWATGLPTHGTCGSASTSYATIARIQSLAEYFVIGITVVVVAVPEGLPMAVTISLAFSMFKMMQDKCFVRHLDASETMGEATCICTDKTGTLTENRMTVVKVMIGDYTINGEGSGDASAAPFTKSTFSFRLRSFLAEAISTNSTCFIKYNEGTGQPIFVGPATEGALLIFLSKLGIDYAHIREQTKKIDNGIWNFSSERKRMSTLVKANSQSPTASNRFKYRLYTKGASEIILGLCTHVMNSDGTDLHEMGSADVSKIQRNIKKWASEGLRTLALAYRDTDQHLTTIEGQTVKDDPEHDLVWIGLIGIKDPVRREVPGAVELCQNAGLKIRMVTGDNILTACKIATECGILFSDGVALEGPVFRAMAEEEQLAIIPRLQVLARSSPSDKHRLVSLLKKMGEVVAVTGDGTNDAPALKEADVGFAMGISGTQIAMNASDIVLLDDNFVSLVQSIKWGRNVLNCVRKFLQFQLCVNLTAIILTFVGSVTVGEPPLSTVQLLWVNLIMDSLGALALATDEPEPDILDHPPHARDAHLLSTEMKLYIITQVVYQTVVLLVILLQGDYIFVLATVDPTDTDHPDMHTKTLCFATFIFMQCTNIVMARQINGELNVFKGFLRNHYFLIILSVIIVVQIIVVTFGSTFVSTVSLDAAEWGLCIGFGLGNMPFTFVVRALTKFYHYMQNKKAGSRQGSSSNLRGGNRRISRYMLNEDRPTELGKSGSYSERSRSRQDASSKDTGSGKRPEPVQRQSSRGLVRKKSLAVE